MLFPPNKRRIYRLEFGGYPQNTGLGREYSTPHTHFKLKKNTHIKQIFEIESMHDLKNVRMPMSYNVFFNTFKKG